jgi:hypothetical protein
LKVQLQQLEKNCNPTGPNWKRPEIQLQLLGFHNEQLQLYNWLQLVATCGCAVA